MRFCKNLYRIILPLGLLIAFGATTPAAYASISLAESSPFVGVDLGESNMELKQNYGNKIFRKNITSYNLFTGLNFNDYFGLELGHQRDNSRRATRTLVAGDYCPGGNIITGGIGGNSPVIFKTYLKSKSTYVGATAQYPILEKLSLTALLGVSRTTIQARHTAVSIAGVPQTDQQIQANLLSRTYKKSKFIPMARIGAKCHLSKSLALRVGVTCLGSSRIKIDSDQNGQPRQGGLVPAPNNSIRLKNSITYSVGVVVSLP